MREARIVEVEQVREEYREKYEAFLLVFNKNNPRVKELEGKLDEASKKEKRELEIEVIRARVIVIKEGCVALCMKCGSYAVKPGKPEKLEGNVSDYDCRVCGYNWLVPKIR